MHCYNPAAFDEKPEDPGVELADVPEIEQIVTYGFRERVPVVLAVPQFGESMREQPHGRPDRFFSVLRENPEPDNHLLESDKTVW